MTYTIPNDIQLGVVSLKVADLERQQEFYEKIVGLETLEADDEKVLLGIKEDKQALLELVRGAKQASHDKPGLYHMAFLLPSRKDLANKLRYILNFTDSLGASNHGYSEAIYLNDLEGNGIEIYADKDMSEWDIREDGSIEGITERMNAREVLALADEDPGPGLPSGTVMGHVHLKVSDVDEARPFFEEALGLGLKSKYNGQAYFYAAGDYHHHLATNIWESKDAPGLEADDAGLNYYTIIMPDADSLKEIKANILDQTIEVTEIENGFSVENKDGIRTHIISQ